MSLLNVHPQGSASTLTNEDLHLSFEPSPDYSGIAKAAAGGKLWAGLASTQCEFRDMLPKAIESVQSGVGAVLEVRLANATIEPRKERL